MHHICRRLPDSTAHRRRITKGCRSVNLVCVHFSIAPAIGIKRPTRVEQAMQGNSYAVFSKCGQQALQRGEQTAAIARQRTSEKQGIQRQSSIHESCHVLSDLLPIRTDSALQTRPGMA